MGYLEAKVVAMSSQEIYVSTDVEADGPIPGPHSMLSFGSAAYTGGKELIGTFSANLETLPGATCTGNNRERRTVFWQRQFCSAAPCAIGSGHFRKHRGASRPPASPHRVFAPHARSVVFLPPSKPVESACWVPSPARPRPVPRCCPSCSSRTLRCSVTKSRSSALCRNQTMGLGHTLTSVTLRTELRSPSPAGPRKWGVNQGRGRFA